MHANDGSRQTGRRRGSHNCSRRREAAEKQAQHHVLAKARHDLETRGLRKEERQGKER